MYVSFMMKQDSSVYKDMLHELPNDLETKV